MTTDISASELENQDIEVVEDEFTTRHQGLSGNEEDEGIVIFNRKSDQEGEEEPDACGIGDCW